MRLRNRNNHRPFRARFTRVALCAAIATAMASGAAVAAAEPASGPAAVHCPRWTALLVPGTFETTPANDPAAPAGALTTVAESLKTRYGNDIDVRTLAPPHSTTEPTEQQALTAALSGLCSETRVVLAGIAEGAASVGDLAAAIGNNHGPLPASRIAAVALVSDPHRDPSTPQLGSPVSGHGIAGPRIQNFADLTDRVRTLCPQRDPYCTNDSEVSPALAAVASAQTAASTAPSPTSVRVSAAEPTVSQALTQVVTVLNGLASFGANVPAIVADLAELPALLGSGDVAGLHRVAGDLNNRFNPLVAMAAGVDLRLVARALALAAPLDTTGVAALASQVVGVLAGLDVLRIATDVGRAQEIAWAAVHAFTAGDPVAAVVALTGLAPVAADLLAATASAFTGTQIPSLIQTYTATTASATTSTAPSDAARTDAADTAVVPATGYDTARVQTEWLEQAVNRVN